MAGTDPPDNVTAVPMNTAVISRITDVMSCAGFCSRDDGLLHAVVLRRGGEIIDLAHDRRGAPIAEGLIGTIEGARDLTAFWSNQDDVRNVIWSGVSSTAMDMCANTSAEGSRGITNVRFHPSAQTSS